MTRAAIGFRTHTGWAVAVTVAGRADALRVIDRRRVALLAAGVPWECYHAAARLPLAKAEALIDRARRTALELARDALEQIGRQLVERGHRLAGAGVVLGGGRVISSVEEAIGSHTARHAAEGQLYRQALIEAANEAGLPTVGVPERELSDFAAGRFGLPQYELRRRVGELGRELGPPWTADHKNAALIAWLALAPRRKR